MLVGYFAVEVRKVTATSNPERVEDRHADKRLEKVKVRNSHQLVMELRSQEYIKKKKKKLMGEGRWL